SRDWVFASAIRGRVASREASGAFHCGCDRGARPSRDERQLSRLWICVVSSANAAGHSGLWLCDGRVFEPQAGAGEARLKAEVADLMAKAEAADAADVPDGMSIPDELARREERLRKIAEARAKIEARAKERHTREQAEHEAKLVAREATRPRQRARSPAASRRSRRPRDRCRAIRSISLTKTHA